MSLMVITTMILLVLLTWFLADRDCAKLPMVVRVIVVILILLHIFYLGVGNAIFQQYKHYIEMKEKDYKNLPGIKKRDSIYCLFFLCEVFIKFLYIENLIKEIKNS